MRFAVITDIHSNLYGLEAVLKDIAGRGIGQIYCAGDLVGYGPRPNEVIELLKNKKIPTIMGNYDDAIGNIRFICGCDYKDEKALKLGEASIAWTGANTTPENKKWLSELPAEMNLFLEGLKIKIVHGSPRALNEYLYENTPDIYIEELLRESGVDVLICGHTHLPYVKKTSAGYIINAGSAGKPKHGNSNVTYVVLDLNEGQLNTEVIEVLYNYELTAREIEVVGLPQEFAAIIRTGCP